MEISFPEKPFEDYMQFVAWFDTEARKNLQGKAREKKTMSYISKKLPRWSESEKKMCFDWCREQVPFPTKVILAYAYNSETFYSYYDSQRGVYVIALPTVFIFLTAYPPIAKAAIKHEFGHIFNGDCIRYLEPKYRGVANVVYDVAINASINRSDLDNLYGTLFGYLTGCPTVPDVQYPKWKLPENSRGWSYEVAMDAALDYEKSKPKQEPPEKMKPEVGMVVKVGNDYSIVVQVDGNNIVCAPISKEDALEIVKQNAEK